MSDEFEQFDDAFDASFLRQIDDIEAAHTHAQPSASSSRPIANPINGAKSLPLSKPPAAPAVKSSTLRSLPLPPAFSAPGRQGTSNSKVANGLPSVATASSSKLPDLGFNKNAPGKGVGAPAATKLPRSPDSDIYDLSMPLSPSALDQIEQIEAVYAGAANQQSTASLRQTTLMGGTVANPPPKPAPAPRPTGMARAPSSHNPFGRPNARTKQWDHTAFAATGSKNKGKGKGKGKGRATYDDEDEEDEEDVEYEQFPAPFVSRTPPAPMKLRPDLEAAKEWLYPLNRPLRDYQYNIVQAALFKNTLCALPTGLGKTFIAGVVMLNYYRWFPEGKVIFVAPTKPLVAQQIEACHETCGIPGEDAVEMTGEVSQAQRDRFWQTKRVFYMTPQTLQNDLERGGLDARDVILLVIDEAHKATGNYAYATVVRFLMAKNPHFRLLALTATPGSKPEAVQAIVDSLHIGHIEIRDEKSLDLREYVHQKHTTQYIVKMDEGILKIKDKLAKLLENTAKPLRGKNIIAEYVNLAEMHHFRCRIWMEELRKKPEGKKFPWATGVLMKLQKYALAMSYLIEESVEMCYNSLIDHGAKTTQKDAPHKAASDPVFKDVISEIESYRLQRIAMGGPVGHPKMDQLSAVALEHFTASASDNAEGHETRVMVFCQFRECVDEIVKSLNLQQPMIHATRFIGQSSDKRGNKGFAQKEQIDVIKRFKQGEFNVLVATSIGEEGLDIGEVDLIICYDAQKSAIKMLQRVGRTGRKRDGQIAVLMGEGREEQNWSSAQESYSNVQQAIIRGNQLELFDDDERLLPPEVKPQCRQTKMEIHPFVRETGRKRKTTEEGGEKPLKRRKRNDDPARNIPQGAFSGFVSAADLVVKGKKGRAKPPPSPKPFDPDDLADDDDDMDIESGRLSPLPKPPPPKRKRAPPKKAAPKRTKGPKEAPDTWATSGFKKASEIAQQLEDDSDDMDIEGGVDALLSGGSESPKRRREPSMVEISSDEGSIELGSPSPKRARSPARPSANDPPPNSAWLLDSDVDIDLTSPPAEDTSTPPQQPSKRALPIDDSIGKDDSIDVDFDVDADIDFSSPVRRSPSHDLSSPARMALHDLSLQKSPQSGGKKGAMGPPPVPRRISSPSEPSPFPVRRPNGRVKPSAFTQESPLAPKPWSPPEEHSSPPSPPPARRKTKKGKASVMSKPNPFFDVEAVLSGSDHGEGGEEDPEGVWSESDRQFLKDSPATQAVSKWDERAMYMQGLMTQAPGGGAGPAFKSGPSRRSRFGGGLPRRVVVSSSEKDPNSEPNEYEFDSFIVPDDDEEEVEREVGL